MGQAWVVEQAPGQGSPGDHKRRRQQQAERKDAAAREQLRPGVKHQRERQAPNRQRLREPQQQRASALNPAKIVKVEEIERRDNQDGRQQDLQPSALGAERVGGLSAEPDVDGQDAARINQRPFENQQSKWSSEILRDHRQIPLSGNAVEDGAEEALFIE